MPDRDLGVVLVNAGDGAYHFALDQYATHGARDDVVAGAGNVAVAEVAGGRRAPIALVAVVLRARGALHRQGVPGVVG